MSDPRNDEKSIGRYRYERAGLLSEIDKLKLQVKRLKLELAGRPPRDTAELADTNVRRKQSGK